jgi:hypothetical protein
MRFCVPTATARLAAKGGATKKSQLKSQLNIDTFFFLRYTLRH